MLPAGRRPVADGYHDRSVLDDLTPEQRAAVTHPGGPAIVLAGAGAGKTRVLCHRLAWLVERRRVAGRDPGAHLHPRGRGRAARPRRGPASARSHETLRVTTFHAYAPRAGAGPRGRARPAAGDDGRAHRGPHADAARAPRRARPARARPARRPRPPGRRPDRSHRQVPRPARERGRSTAPGPRSALAGAGRRRRPPGAARGRDRAGLRGPRPLAGRGRARGLRPLDRPRPRAAAGPPRPPRGRPRGGPPRAGRRVPGHEPRPGRAALPARRRRRRA